MKIKMIDLFKLMLEREAPKKIRVLGIDMTFIETAEWGDYKDDGSCRLSSFRLTDCLNEDVEIIEEPKKIEKLVNKIDTSFEEANYSQRMRLTEMVNKINELIDEINKLKEND